MGDLTPEELVKVRALIDEVPAPEAEPEVAEPEPEEAPEEDEKPVE